MAAKKTSDTGRWAAIYRTEGAGELRDRLDELDDRPLLQAVFERLIEHEADGDGWRPEVAAGGLRTPFRRTDRPR